MKLRDVPAFKRPREKLQARGGEGVTDVELLAIILRTGYRGRNAVEVAENMLKTRSLPELLQLETLKLQKIKGLGPSRVALLQAIKAIMERYSFPTTQPIISNPKDSVALFSFLKTKKQEHLIALYLNARYQVLAQEIISIGTLDSSLIHPREVFAPALSHRAAHVILAHNHPSGDPYPSHEDVVTTERLVEVGQLLDIPLLDHLIIAIDGWQSMKELNLL